MCSLVELVRGPIQLMYAGIQLVRTRVIDKYTAY